MRTIIHIFTIGNFLQLILTLRRLFSSKLKKG